MDQDSKLITEAYLAKIDEYRAPSNRGKGHHGEGLTRREEIELDINELDKRANEASDNGDDRTAERLDGQADELRNELRKMGPRKVPRMRIESAPAIQELEARIEQLELDAEAAYRRDDMDIGEDLDRRAEDLRSELRSLSLMQRNLRREDVEEDDEPIEDFSSYEDLLVGSEKAIDELIGKVVDHASTLGEDTIKARREVGDMMVEKIYRDLMRINSSEGYVHQGHTFGRLTN